MMHSENLEGQMQFQLSLLRLVCRETPVSPSGSPQAATEKIEALVKRFPPPPGR